MNPKNFHRMVRGPGESELLVLFASLPYCHWLSSLQSLLSRYPWHNTVIPFSSTLPRKKTLRKAKPNWLKKWQVWWANLRRWRNEAPTVVSSKISDSNLIWQNPQKQLEFNKCDFLRQYNHEGGQLKFGQKHRDMDSRLLRCLPGVLVCTDERRQKWDQHNLLG